MSRRSAERRAVQCSLNERTSFNDRVFIDFGADRGIDELLDRPCQGGREHSFAALHVDDSCLVVHISVLPESVGLAGLHL